MGRGFALFVAFIKLLGSSYIVAIKVTLNTAVHNTIKITFINEIANLCEQVGADIGQVAAAMGKDGRISPK